MSLTMRVLKASYHKSFQRYQTPFRNQEALLRRILKDNADSAYGKLHRFAQIGSKEQFVSQVPLVDYDALEPWIERIKDGQKQVLTKEEVLLLEPTGGSSGTEKLIPYTAALRRDYQISIEAWLYALLKQYPDLMGGKSYWMITPPLFDKRSTAGGIPIGFEDDAQYLGALGAFVMKQVMIRPNIYPGMDTEAFYDETLRALLEAGDLRLISVWNPSLLVQLIEHLWHHLPTILMRLSKKRRMQVRKALYAKDLKAVWPQLRLISCWMNGQAEREAKRLQALFSGVDFQAKGLLATEAVITIPSSFSTAGGLLPAYHSTYFEFLQGEKSYPLEALKMHERYEVVITTSGGLYRYRLGDVVEVRAFHDRLPLLAFVERQQTVDLVGEKLTPSFIEKQFAPLGGFFLFAPLGGGYGLYTDQAVSSQAIEQRLRNNYHYALARDMGQLQAVQVFRIEGNAHEQYLDNLRQAGMRLGDIKSAHLSAREHWTFKGVWYK